MTKEQLKSKLESGCMLSEIFDFIDGQECLIYKGEFETTDNIIYIPDIYLNEIEINACLSSDEIANVIEHCYSGQDFMTECKGHEKLARELFSFVDWQHPNIQDVLDTYDEDEFEETYGISMDKL